MQIFVSQDEQLRLLEILFIYMTKHLLVILLNE